MSTIKNDRRTIFGWAMYDWANSAYSTVIAGAILPAFFVGEVVGDDGWNGRTGDNLWALGLALGTLLLFVAMPVLGAVADYSASKKRSAWRSTWPAGQATQSAAPVVPSPPQTPQTRTRASTKACRRSP